MANALLQSVFKSIGAWIVLAWGQQFVDSGLASVLNSTSPVVVFLVTATITCHEVPGIRKFPGCVIGVIGVTSIVGIDPLSGLGGQVARLLGASL